MTKLVTKLSVKTVAGKIAAPAENADPIIVAEFVGIADGHKSVQSPFGDAVEFLGNFAGKSAKGVEYRARKLFLPGVAEELLIDAMARAGDGVPVEFGFRIAVIHSEKGTTGYAYIAEPLFENRETDPLAALIAKANKALPPPDAEKPAPAKKK